MYLTLTVVGSGELQYVNCRQRSSLLHHDDIIHAPDVQRSEEQLARALGRRVLAASFN